LRFYKSSQLYFSFFIFTHQQTANSKSWTIH